MWLVWILVALSSPCLITTLPLVDPGLFVISGVKTCGNGNGYCLLGLDCTLDEDFVQDDQGGHCEGLKYAFTPSAHFVCCKAANLSLDHSTMIFPGEEMSEEIDDKNNATTPNVMENEIEQMLLKLAESINSVKQNESITSSEELEEGDDGLTMVKNGTETSEEFKPNEPEEITESFEEELEIEDVLGGENITLKGTIKPDLTGDQAYGHNNTNLDAEWMEQTFVPHKDILDKITIKNENVDEINDVVISTLDRNEQLNNVDASFYSIMQKEIDHLMGNGFKAVQDERTNSTSGVLTSLVSGGHNQSVTSNLVQSMNANIHNTETPVQSEGTTLQPDKVQGQCADRHECISVKFMYKDNVVCFGSILSQEWTLTSASCAMRIFRAGLMNVTAQRLNSSEDVLLKTIVVHENYKEQFSGSGQTIEANNIGLIRIKNPIESWKDCVPWLPFQGQDFSGNNCSSLFNYTTVETKSDIKQEQQPKERSNDSEPSDVQFAAPLCEGSVIPIVGEYGQETFLTLACGSLWRPRDYNILKETGAPLLCNGVLAGIESSSGIGTLVYTPVSRYLSWLHDNAKPSSQKFHDV